MPFYDNYKVGILGGGQLGRMLVQAGMDFNLDFSVLDPDASAPCSRYIKDFVTGSLNDFDRVYVFGKEKDLVTIEIESVHTGALRKLEEEGVKVYPQPRVIEIIQDKRQQKQFYSQHQIPTSEFVLIDRKENLEKFSHFLPAFQKLGKEGYDGRGVYRIDSKLDFVNALEGPSLLEKKVDFEKELSVLVARNTKGEISLFPVVEMVFNPVRNLVDFLFAPAEISSAVAKQAGDIAVEVIRKLDMVGLLAVEMFLDKNGSLFVNEVAPRPHNSGHQTIKANFTSQYEQHLRAILGLPLGETRLKTPAAMINLLGEPEYEGKARYVGIEKVLATEGVFVHLYGKAYTKPFRKMGHVTVLDPDILSLKKKVQFVKETLKVIA